eukprot:UC1_evm2s1125
MAPRNPVTKVLYAAAVWLTTPSGTVFFHTLTAILFVVRLQQQEPPQQVTRQSSAQTSATTTTMVSTDAGDNTNMPITAIDNQQMVVPWAGVFAPSFLYDALTLPKYLHRLWKYFAARCNKRSAGPLLSLVFRCRDPSINYLVLFGVVATLKTALDVLLMLALDGGGGGIVPFMAPAAVAATLCIILVVGLCGEIRAS